VRDEKLEPGVFGRVALHRVASYGGWNTILSPSSHSEPCVLPDGDYDDHRYF
jgi:hypothetical protein